jgi:hypothetical protein
MILSLVLALLFYPGLLLVVALGVLFVVLVDGSHQAPAQLQSLASPSVWGSAEGRFHILGILCAGIGLACMPWPFLSVAPGSPGVWVLAWAGLEAAFLLPLVPGLLAGFPPVVRAAIREAQIGVSGRMLLWLAIMVGLVLQVQGRDDGSLSLLLLLLAYGLAIAAAGFAFPSAITWGQFAAETSISPGGVAQGLGRSHVALITFVRAVRAAALLAATLVALVPAALLPVWAHLVGIGVVWVVVALGLKKSRGSFPNLPLPDALRHCWWRALPPGIAAILLLAIMA